MSNVQLGYTQVIDPISFKSIPSGKIYIGEYGTLPNPANAGTWKQAYFVQDDGSRIAASQPIRTNAAGFAVDSSGNIKTVQVDGQYSLLIQDSFGVQKYSNTRVIDLAADLANTTDPAKGAALVGFMQSIAGSVARTSADKHRERITVEDFGADPTGVTSSVAAFQAAINSGKHVETGFGQYLIDGLITVPPSAAGGSLTVRGKLLVNVTKWLLIDGADRYQVLAGHNAEISFGLVVTDNTGGLFGRGVHVRNSAGVKVKGFRVTALSSDRTTTAFVTATASSRNGEISDNWLTDIGRGVNLGWTDEIAEQDANNIPTSGWKVLRNRFDTCGRSSYAVVMVRSRNNSYGRADAYAKTRHTIANNEFNGIGGTGVTEIAIEYWSDEARIYDNDITGNAVDTYSHIAISCAKAYDAKIRGNTISGAWNYQGIELATCNNCQVIGNTIIGLTNASANGAAIGVSNGQVGDPVSTGNIIRDNQIIACRIGVLTGGANTATPYAVDTQIVGNIFQGTAGSGGASIRNNGSRTLIQGNRFSGITPIDIVFGDLIEILNNPAISTASAIAINVQSTVGAVRIKGNSFYGWGSPSAASAIYLANSTPAHIQGNTFTDDGRDKTGWGVSIHSIAKGTSSPSVDTSHYIGPNFFTNVAAQLGSNVGSYGPASTATGRSYYAGNTGGKILFGGAVPTGGTWAVGDRIFNSSPAVGQPKSWVCTVAGTPGTWVSEGNL